MIPDDKLRELGAAAESALDARAAYDSDKVDGRIWKRYMDSYVALDNLCRPATIAELVREVLAARAGNVPREPTQEMLDAGYQTKNCPEDIWRAMYDAAQHEKPHG